MGARIPVESHGMGGLPNPPATHIPPAPGPVVLRRTMDRVVAGVCGGFARHLGVDPVIVRVAFVLLTVFGGSGVLLYLICIFIIPEESPTDPVGRAENRSSATVTRGLLGLLLIMFGFVMLLTRSFPAVGDYMGPALLISFGVLVLVIEGRR